MYIYTIIYIDLLNMGIGFHPHKTHPKRSVGFPLFSLLRFSFPSTLHPVAPYVHQTLAVSVELHLKPLYAKSTVYADAFMYPTCSYSTGYIYIYRYIYLKKIYLKDLRSTCESWKVPRFGKVPRIKNQRKMLEKTDLGT